MSANHGIIMHRELLLTASDLLLLPLQVGFFHSVPLRSPLAPTHFTFNIDR